MSRRPTKLQLLTTTSTLLALALAAQVLAAPVTLSPTGDANGSLGAASGTGDAEAADDCAYVPVPVALPGCVAGVAASATGNSSACPASYYGLVPCAGVAASVVGDASGCDSSYPSLGLAPNCAVLALSGMGDSTACRSTPAAYTDMPGCVGIAASGTGDADVCADAEDSRWYFLWTSCVGVAVSGTGDARACGNDDAVTLQDSRCIGVAASGCDVSATVCTRRAEATVPTGVTPGEDADGDGFPATLTVTTTRASVDGNAPNASTSPDEEIVLAVDPDDADPTRPLAQQVRVRLPTGIAPGPDADRDGFPAYVDLTTTDLVVSRNGTITTEPTGTPISRVTLDPNDHDPARPAASVVSASYASGVALGPDADRDGVPSSVRVEMSTLRLDRRDPANATSARDPSRDITVRTDANDNDPNVPATSVVRQSVPTGLAQGPDADRDGVPSTVRVETSTLTLDRRDPANATFVRDPARDTFVRLDPNDNDPNNPATSVVRQSIPTGAAPGPDQDRDGFPATATVEFSSVTYDRRDPTNASVVRDPARDVVVRPDANDQDPNVPVASSASVPFVSAVVPGPDADGDGAPAYVTLEASELRLDRRDATNATIVRTPANDRRVNVDPNDREALVAASVDGDAQGDLVAVSVFGDADATCARGACLAASGFGDATACARTLACAAASGAGNASGYLAASGLGDATACDLDFLCTAVSGTGDASASDLAVSALGDAQSGYVALSGTGDADGALPLSALGRCNGRACASAQGDGHWVGVATSGDARGIVAATPEGEADGGLLGVSATGPARGGIVAASVTGDAESGLVAASATGDAEAPIPAGG